MKFSLTTPCRLRVGTAVLAVTALIAGQNPPRAAAEEPVRFSPQVSAAKMSDLVHMANRDADAAYAGVAEAGAKYFQQLRQPKRLRPFVAELLSLEQKLQFGADWWNQADSRRRIRALFRKHVADDERLARDLADTANRYQELLAAQDYVLLTEGGVHPSTARQAAASLAVRIPRWDGLFDTTIRQAVNEAQVDVVRGVGVLVASDVIGDGVEELGRSLELYGVEEGSLLDLFSGLAIDAAISAAMEEIVDPTDQIVADLSKQLERVQAEAFDGPRGLLALLRKMNETHQAARRRWLKPSVR